MRHFYKSLVAGAALVAFSGLTQAAAVTASLSSPAVEGGSFLVSLQGTGFDKALDGGGLGLTFDASALELLSVSIDPSWSFFADEGVIDNVAGTLTDLSFNVWGGKTGDFKIADLTFLAKRGGQTTVSTAPSVMFPFGSGGEELQVQHGSLTVSVATVPEPSVAVMTLFGVVAGLALARRRREATVSG